jgi:hypothetical protein
LGVPLKDLRDSAEEVNQNKYAILRSFLQDISPILYISINNVIIWLSSGKKPFTCLSIPV